MTFGLGFAASSVWLPNPPMMNPASHPSVSTRWSTATLLLALVTVLLTFGGVLVQEVHGTAVFYAAMAREMVETGDLLSPFRGETGYLLKPPLAFWWGAANSLLLGYSNLAMTLPSRLGGLACVWMTALLALHIHRKASAGWFAALLFMANGIYIQFTTAFRLDSLMTFGALLVLWGYFNLPRTRGAVALWGGIALSLMTKGPMVLVMLLVLVPHALVSRHWAGCWPALLRWSPILLVPLAWYGFIVMFHGEELARQLTQDFWRGDTSKLSRFDSVWLEYVTKPQQRLGPWLILIFLALVHETRVLLNRDIERRRRADAALLLALTGMNLVIAVMKPDPDVRYLYTVLPLIAVMVGGMVSRWVGSAVPRWAVMGCGAALIALLPAVVWYNVDRLDERRGLLAMEALAASGEFGAHNGMLMVENIPNPKAPRRNDPVTDAVYFYFGLKLERVLRLPADGQLPPRIRFLLVPQVPRLLDEAHKLNWSTRAQSEKFRLLERPVVP